jgi:ATP-binding cassette subfamily G (WHITE) protein 2 (SNQ2)
LIDAEVDVVASARWFMRKSTLSRLLVEAHSQSTLSHFRTMLTASRYGDPLSLYGKWGGIFFQALIVGSLFYNLQPTAAGAFPRGGVIFFMLLFNALLALAELTSAFESRPILLKHKSFSFYRPAAYAIAQTVVDIPLVFIQVMIFDVVVYFMANLQRTTSQFFISLLFLWIITMSMYAFFRAIGALVGSLDIATRITGVAIQALIVYTGYLIPPSKMHPWFSWFVHVPTACETYTDLFTF